MALLTATELKTSREAIEAGINTVADADATTAIDEAEAFLCTILGFRIEVPEASMLVRGLNHSTIYLPEKVRSISALSEDGRTVSSADFTLTARGWVLKRNAGVWAHSTDEGNIQITGAFGFAAGDPKFKLAKKVVKLLAVRYLQSTQSGDGFPAGPAGGYLTGYATEGAQFTFFTPKGDTTGYVDIDRMVKQLREKPRGPGRLMSVPLQSSVHP